MTHVESRTSCLVDQETFFSSTITSEKKFLIFPNIFISIFTGQAGVEPATFGFGDRRSTNWSYWPIPHVTDFFIQPRHPRGSHNLAPGKLTSSLLGEEYASGKNGNTSLVLTVPAVAFYLWCWRSCTVCIQYTQAGSIRAFYFLKLSYFSGS